MISTRTRSTEPEIMDDMNLEGSELTDALDKIAWINRILGGNRVTINGIEQLLRNKNQKEIHIVDLGCGNGDMLRTIKIWAEKRNLNVRLTGIDGNQASINHAIKLSDSSIRYSCSDFLQVVPDEPIDIVICTLTLHHFEDELLLEVLRKYYEKANVGLVINDLHRSKQAYYLFTALAVVFRLNRMSKSDGLVSILRGFKKADFLRYAKQLNFTKFSICWKWAYRYQWIIYKT
ncbi:methyltransferase domain-containing protein [Flavobacterium sp.]|uniref:methyltransferase domain-containing protein n=1 Tax=Flavobacterium sp. TaxID=239 RepID=UPI00261C8C50|nr:methyltransferase domain-containing protein [Flavobacterium sp.]